MSDLIYFAIDLRFRPSRTEEDLDDIRRDFVWPMQRARSWCQQTLRYFAAKFRALLRTISAGQPAAYVFERAMPQYLPIAYPLCQPVVATLTEHSSAKQNLDEVSTHLSKWELHTGTTDTLNYPYVSIALCYCSLVGLQYKWKRCFHSPGVIL